MIKIPRVALLIETSRGYGRALLRGIVHYASLHGPWEFFISPGDFEQTLPDMKAWGGTGIIARVETSGLAQRILELHLPFIGLDVSQNIELDIIAGGRFHEIDSDSRQAARMAADHLLSRGLKRFAYVGEATRAWSQNRLEGFKERLAEAGSDLTIYPTPRTDRDREWAYELPMMVNWLKNLDKPTGILASSDDRGRQVLEACSAAGLRVPFEAMVIGVDNDQLLCDLSRPPLSSVALNTEKGGFRAAALLDRLMRGEQLEPQRLLVEPTHVVERRSTALQATIQDGDVIAALDFLQTHAGEPITIEDVVSQLNISRRSFEIKFQQEMGVTPHHALRQLRLDRAKRLLVETDQSVASIALASGYCTPTHLSQTFRKELNTTPSEYRQSYR